MSICVCVCVYKKEREYVLCMYIFLKEKINFYNNHSQKIFRKYFLNVDILLEIYRMKFQHFLNIMFIKLKIFALEYQYFRYILFLCECFHGNLINLLSINNKLILTQNSLSKRTNSNFNP